MATFNYVTKDNMGATLDHKINKRLVTTVLGTPDVSFMNGGKSFTLRDITVSGFKPHSRGKGWNSGEIKDSKTVYTMTQDRDIEFLIVKILMKLIKNCLWLMFHVSLLKMKFNLKLTVTVLQ